MADWKPAYEDTQVRRYGVYQGLYGRPTRKGSRALGTEVTPQSIHLRVQIQYCACEPSEVLPGHAWNDYGQVTKHRFRAIATEDVVFEVTSSKNFDQGSMQIFLARKGEEVPMSQDELDWARYWGENGCLVGLHPTSTWIDNRDE